MRILSSVCQSDLHIHVKFRFPEAIPPAVGLPVREGRKTQGGMLGEAERLHAQRLAFRKQIEQVGAQRFPCLLYTSRCV